MININKLVNGTVSASDLHIRLSNIHPAAGITIKNMTPGEHSVIASKDGVDFIIATSNLSAIDINRLINLCKVEIINGSTITEVKSISEFMEYMVGVD